VAPGFVRNLADHSIAPSRWHESAGARGRIFKPGKSNQFDAYRFLEDNSPPFEANTLSKFLEKLLVK
jgi:hypothetical protein